MKTCRKILFLQMMLLLSLTAFGQQTDEVKKLVEQGIALNDSGKYSEAINKYQEALKIDPANLGAQYELAFTLSNSGKPNDAIPYLEKVAASNTIAEAYDLLGSIYDDAKDPEKAIAYYKQGIIAFPNYERLHFNLGITYLRLKQYPEAEAEGIEALKLDPTHASAHRLYAMATQEQGKRANALLAWCNFLLLEPQSKRSSEAIVSLKRIVNYGISKKDGKNVNVNISTSDLNSLNLGMTLAIINATSSKPNLSSVDSLSLQLNSLFPIISEQAPDKDPFFSKYYAKYFNNMTDSGNIPALAHYITLSAWKDEDITWFNSHDAELKNMQKWLSDNTKRDF